MNEVEFGEPISSNSSIVPKPLQTLSDEALPALESGTDEALEQFPQFQEDAVQPITGDDGAVLGWLHQTMAGESLKLPRHPVLQIPTMVWVYHDSAGTAMGWVCRFETADGKQYRQLTRSEGRWRWKGPQAPAPLYHLPRVMANPEKTIVVCEGEKAADAAAQLLPDCVATTSLGGAKSPEKSDWTVVRGRRVLVWPDADVAGMEYALRVRDLCAQTGVARVDIMDVAVIWEEPLADKHGKDAADWLRIEGDEELPQDVLPLWTSPEDAAAMTTPPNQMAVTELKPYYFMLHADGAQEGGQGSEAKDVSQPGLYYVGVIHSEKRGKPVSQYARPIWVCIPFTLMATCDDGRGYGYGIAIRFRALHGQMHQWTIPRSLLVIEGRELYEKLYDMGFHMDIDGGPKHLRRYLNRARPKLRALSVTHIGWAENHYVLPDEVFGPQPERIFYQSESPNPSPYTTKGSLDGWRNGVALPIEPFDMAVFGLATAFAAPLMAPCRVQTGGFHLKGLPATGKSTLTLWALSAWGSFKELMKSWHGTAVGFETTAAACCDSLLVLDEIGRGNSTEVGEIVYMLCNENGKLRATQRLATQRIQRWQMLILSSGEKSLAQIMEEGGQTVVAGQELRLAHIPADIGDGCGIFSGLMDRAERVKLLDSVTEAAIQNYGVPIREYLSRLTQEIGKQNEIIRQVQEIAATMAGPTATSEIARVAQRFALVGYAGELATSYGITGWQPGRALSAAFAMFNRWREHWGDGRRDETNFLRHFEEWLSGVEMGHMAEVDPHTLLMSEETRIRSISMKQFYGYKTVDPVTYNRRYYLNSAAWKAVTKGCSTETAIQALAQAGRLFLRDPKQPNSGQSIRIGEKGNKQRYFGITLPAEDGES